MSQSLPEFVSVNEVGPREGIQSESQTISSEQKIAFVDSLSETGLEDIQVTTLAHPRVVPQHADAERVMAAIQRPPGVQFSVLVPNLKGAERAVETNADKWGIMLSVSDSHSQSNANRSTMEALRGVEDIVALGRQKGVPLTGGMATALGCPFEGRIPQSRLRTVIEAYLDLGLTEIGVADTVGVTDPVHVYDTMSSLLDLFPTVNFKLHLHNTRGMGLANVLAGLQAGVTTFDASVGGLGGCPFAPGASGNIATEDLVHMLELIGVRTNVDLRSLIRVSHEVPQLVDHPVDSFVAKAGTSSDLHDLNEARIAKA